jgi:hypothetical protein
MENCVYRHPCQVYQRHNIAAIIQSNHDAAHPCHSNQGLSFLGKPLWRQVSCPPRGTSTPELGSDAALTLFQDYLNEPRQDLGYYYLT